MLSDFAYTHYSVVASSNVFNKHSALVLAEMGRRHTSSMLNLLLVC